MNKQKVTRRTVFQAAATSMAAGMIPAHAAPTASSNVYTRIGVTPFINTTATFTINGGAPMLPEVKQAMDDASNWAVNLDELMEKAGARVAELLGAEAAIISSGCAAALAHATAACIAGGDPEKMKRLPDSSGMRNEVLIARQSRNDYDHAYRTGGGKLVEYDTREEFEAALGHRTGMIVVLGTGEAKGKLRLEEIAAAAHKLHVPVLVDAAAELPTKPNPFLSRGADLVTYSGGKILRGPQSAGVLAGRKDLVRAAWWNSAPHHSYGRAMKVSKEEIIGMVTALELFYSKRDLKAEYREWESWYKLISDQITQVDGVKTKPLPPAGASPFPVLEVTWDPAKISHTGEEVHALLLNGEPRIMSHAQGESTTFVIRAVSMRPEHPPLVARRLVEVFRQGMKPRPAAQPAAGELTGTWEVDLEFVSGKTRHLLTFEPPRGNSNRLRGVHVGQTAQGRFRGSMKGASLSVQSELPIEGMHIKYSFVGNLEKDVWEGALGLGEFGQGRFRARRVQG